MLCEVSHQNEMTSPNIKSPWLFFLIALGLTWIFWIPAAFIRGKIIDTPWIILLYLGGIGPMVAAIVLTYRASDRTLIRDYWKRAFDPRKIRAPWYLIILSAYPVLILAISLAEKGQVQFAMQFKEMLNQPARLIPFMIFIFIFGPLPEELGWRGYALDGLQKRMNAVLASLVLGTVWAIWHVPLFFMGGTYQQELGFGTPAFWRFSISAIVVSVFFTWIYNNNRRSTLSAALFHFSLNLPGNILIISESQETYRVFFLILLAILLVGIYSYKNRTWSLTLTQPI